jgi:predicted transcriptional regulator
MDSDGLFAYLVGRPGGTRVPPLTLMASLETGPRSLEDLANEYGVDRATIYRTVTPAVEAHTLTTTDDGYALTGLGACLLYQYRRINETFEIDRDALALLGNSSHRRTLLRRLRRRPSRKADLVDCEGTPSRATVHRAISEFEDRGWVNRSGDTGLYSLTDAGCDVLDGFDTFETAVAHAHEYTFFLAPLDHRIADIPLDGLSNSRLVVESNLATGQTEAILKDIVEEDPKDVCTFNASVSTRLADIYDPIIRSSARVRILLTERVLYALPTQGRYTNHVRRGLQSTNVSVRVVPDVESLPVNMGIHDDETVVIGPPDAGKFIKQDGQLKTAAIVSSDPTLIEWAKTLWQTYDDRSISLTRQVIQSILNRIRLSG